MTPQYIVINEFGTKYYYKDKEMTILHREDGPAYEGCNGTKVWWLNGKLHREDGPAVEWSSGSKYWYLNGVCFSKRTFIQLTTKEIILTMDEIAAKLGIDVSKLKIKK
jgi:hypothetical protein